MASDFLLVQWFWCARDVFAQLPDIYGVDCDLDLDCDLMHQPTPLGREPRVCTAGRVQMLSLALR